MEQLDELRHAFGYKALARVSGSFEDMQSALSMGAPRRPATLFQREEDLDLVKERSVYATVSVLF